MKKKERPGWPYKQEFKCHRCGNCCRGNGYVDMTPDDIDRAAGFLGITVEEFRQEYCIDLFDQTILRDQEDDLKSCIFLFEDEEGLAGCRIHGEKPTQCAGFPFLWRPKNILKFCDGMRALEGLEPTRSEGRSDIDARGGKR